MPTHVSASRPSRSPRTAHGCDCRAGLHPGALRPGSLIVTPRRAARVEDTWVRQQSSSTHARTIYARRHLLAGDGHRAAPRELARISRQRDLLAGPRARQRAVDIIPAEFRQEAFYNDKHQRPPPADGYCGFYLRRGKPDLASSAPHPTRRRESDTLRGPWCRRVGSRLNVSIQQPMRGRSDATWMPGAFVALLTESGTDRPSPGIDEGTC